VTAWSLWGQRASSLVDLCRQTIVFGDLAGIAGCIGEIGADPAVRVLRLKNRFDPGFAASGGAGYRDLCINLRLVTDETTRLGVENHVCELQLLLKSFAELKVNIRPPRRLDW
jgi:hypothetical protein